MELLKKIKSYGYYLYYYKSIKETRAFCKKFMQNNLSTISISALYCEKAVKNFYERILDVDPNLQNKLINIFEGELDGYDDVRRRIKDHQHISRREYNKIISITNYKNIYDTCKSHGSMEEVINYCHKSIVNVFNSLECDLIDIFKKE